MVDSSHDEDRQRQLVHALLLEWTLETEVQRGRNFVDFLTVSPGPLGSRLDSGFVSFWVLETTETSPACANSGTVGAKPRSLCTWACRERHRLEPFSEVEINWMNWPIELPVDEAGKRRVVHRPRRFGGPFRQSRHTIGACQRAPVVTTIGAQPGPASPPENWPTGPRIVRAMLLHGHVQHIGSRGTSWGTEKRGQVRPDGCGIARHSSVDNLRLQGKLRWVRTDLPRHSWLRRLCQSPRRLDAAPSWPTSLPTRELGIPHERQWVVSPSKRPAGPKGTGVELALATVRARDLIRFGVLLKWFSIPMEGRLSVNWDEVAPCRRDLME